MCNHIAVYGSLRVGHGANHFMQGLDLVSSGEETVKGRLFSLGGFPGLKLGSSENIDVLVDVYELPKDPRTILARLDQYEGYVSENQSNSLFIRRKTLTSDNIEVWVYEYNGDVSQLVEIKHGDWTKHVNK